MPTGHVPTAAYEEVAAELNSAEIAALVALIVAINAWNAVGVSTRRWEVGSYQPPSNGDADPDA